MTKLKAWLFETQTRQNVLAERLGITRGHMSAVVSGLRQPSLALAVQIEAETQGAVPATSLLRPPQPPTEDAA